MYKSKLQELCHRRCWQLPEYTTSKDGPDHMPRFTATVNVHGEVFQTPAECKSAKDAQNAVAQIAFEHFYVAPPQARRTPAFSSPAVSSPLSVVPSAAPIPAVPLINSVTQPVAVSPVPPAPPVSTANEPPTIVSPLPTALPIPTPGFLAAHGEANRVYGDKETLHPNSENSLQPSDVFKASILSSDKNYKDTLYMYKNLLQQFAQKQNFTLPVYTNESEGPPHARRFKARVIINGKSYETLEFFSTLKEAEQAAAKVACQALSVDVIQEDRGLYKNLLQEFAQRKGLLCPSYETIKFGMSHRPVFVSTVSIGDATYRGAEAKTKKEAETNVAKIAYCALTEKSGNAVKGCAPADNVIQNIQLSATIENIQDAGEESESHAKRVKSSSEDVNVKAHLPGPSCNNIPSDNLSSDSSQVEHSTTDKTVAEQPVEGQPCPAVRIVVTPRNSSLPIPPNASVMPHSDNQWVAYKVEQKPIV